MKVEDCEGRSLYLQVIVQYLLEPSKAHWLHLCTTRFNIKEFYILPTQFIYVLCRSQNKQLLPYTSLTDCVYTLGGEW